MSCDISELKPCIAVCNQLITCINPNYGKVVLINSTQYLTSITGSSPWMASKWFIFVKFGCDLLIQLCWLTFTKKCTYYYKLWKPLLSSLYYKVLNLLLFIFWISYIACHQFWFLATLTQKICLLQSSDCLDQSKIVIYSDDALIFVLIQVPIGKFKKIFHNLLFFQLSACLDKKDIAGLSMKVWTEFKLLLYWLVSPDVHWFMLALGKLHLIQWQYLTRCQNKFYKIAWT